MITRHVLQLQACDGLNRVTAKRRSLNAVADTGSSTLIPKGRAMRQAGSLMLALHTAHDAVFTHGQVQPGDAVLIHGAAAF